MTEDVLQLIWQHRLYRQEPFLTEEGEVLEIIHPGLLNRDAGPDFFNAKIKIDGILWAGNVEVHHQASDWHRHKHHQNPAFDNVILHVVTKSGGCTFNSKGRKIPVCQNRLHCGYAATGIFQAEGTVRTNEQKLWFWAE